nr:phosphopantetheine-binding protein [Methylobacterium sp. ZNC0032]
MNVDPQDLRRTVVALLAEAGHAGPIGDSESLFLSGRLDSLAAAEILALLERDYGLDLADADFDITGIDTLARLEALARQQPA